MVVMVILLIGVFAIIRIFPIGFGTLQANENRGMATRLARAQMEQLKSDEDNLPRGVLYSEFDGSGGRQFNTTVDPDDLKDFVDSRSNRVNPYYSDINKFRFIEGEPVKVPLPTALGAGTFAAGSLYTVKFGPVYMNQAVGDPESVPTSDAQRAAFGNYLRVYGSPLRSIQVDADQISTGNAFRMLRGPQTYLLDPGEDGSPARIMFAPSRRERTFLISFSYESNGGILDEEKVPIPVPADQTLRNYQWFPITTANGASVSEVLPESVVVVREFERLAASNPDWDDQDPYQFKLISGNISIPAASARDTYANMGVLAFNPAGANYSERTAFGQRAFVAYVDYAVLDWHILREDREVPSVTRTNNAIPIRVSLPAIKRVGEPEVNGTIYEGLYRDRNAKVDIQVFDLQGRVVRDPILNPGLGDPLIPGDWAARNGADANADYWIDRDDRNGTYDTGTLYINPDRVPEGSQIRILYKAEGDWAVGIQKAYYRYQQLYNDAGEPQRFPGVGSFDKFGKDGAGSNAQLIFPRSDLNKSVLVTLQYPVAVNGSTTPEFKRLQPIQMTIDRIVRDPNGIEYAAIDVFQYIPFLQRDEFTQAGNDWRVFGNPAGVSMKTRVIWRDNNSPSNSWRVQDVDTFITRGTGS